jgi:hypothetical protein
VKGFRVYTHKKPGLNKKKVVVLIKSKKKKKTDFNKKNVFFNHWFFTTLAVIGLDSVVASTCRVQSQSQ